MPVCHISPYKVSEGILSGAARLLSEGGHLFIYGPFMVDGEHTSPSNADFDLRLRVSAPVQLAAPSLPCTRQVAAAGSPRHLDASLIHLLVFAFSSARERVLALLQAQNSEWGVRDSTVLAELAVSYGLELIERAQMPANNFVLVFRYRGRAPSSE